MRWWALEVSGPSMAPTLHHGDWVIARRTPRVRVGDIVVARRPDRPDLLVVKRLARITDEGFWLAGDNSFASDDSEVFGSVPQVEAKVMFRYRPQPTWLARRR